MIGDDNRAFPSLAHLEEATLLNRKTIVASLAALQAQGLIVDTKERIGRTKQIPVYQLRYGNSPKNGTVKQSQIFHETVPFLDGNSPKNGTRTRNYPCTNQKELMASPSFQAEAAKLHAAYNEITGSNLRVGIGEYSRERCWFDFIKAGFTEDDLRCVVRHLRREIKESRRQPSCLKFSNLVEHLERFEEDLGMARAKERKAPAPVHQRALNQLRPTVTAVTPNETKVTARPVSELIENLKKAAGMRV